VHLSGLAEFLWVFGAFLGSWSKIVGDLRNRPALVWAAGVSLAAILCLTGLFYLRDADVSGSYQAYAM
jgi:hypothetical protein